MSESGLFDLEGGAGDLLHRVLDAGVDGEEYLAAEDGLAVRAHGLGSEVVVERVLDAVPGHIVRPDVADDVRGESALGIEPAEIVLHPHAGELSL